MHARKLSALPSCLRRPTRLGTTEGTDVFGQTECWAAATWSKCCWITDSYVQFDQRPKRNSASRRKLLHEPKTVCLERRLTPGIEHGRSFRVPGACRCTRGGCRCAWSLPTRAGS